MKKLHTIFLLAAFTQACDVATLSSGEGGVPDAPEQQSIELDSEFPETESELATILTADQSKNWFATGFEILKMSGFQNCRLDDQIALNADGTYDYDGGSDLCGAEDDSRIKSGNWELNFDDQTLVFDRGTEFEAVAEIVSASENKLILRGEYFGWDLVGRYEANI